MTKILAMFTISLALGQIAIAHEVVRPDDKQIENFTLRDYRGKNHSLDDFKNRDVIVLVVLGTECPLAKLYAPRLAKLSKEFESKNVQFLGINSNSQDSITEIAAHARIHEIEFPVLKDAGNRVADQIGAERTPEVFVLNKERKVVYHGRVDDQFGVGYTRNEPRRHDLKIALEELVAGKKVSVSKTDLAGCFIGRVKKAKSGGSVTFSNQISRLLQKHCVECHREGEIAPFALKDYDEVVGWAEMIEEVLTENRMPPWHASKEHGEFANDRRMSDEEKKLIYQWVKDGAPQGDPKNMPEPRAFTSGWQLPEDPDILVINEKEPFVVQPEGEVEYKYFRVKTKFKEDKWISAVQILPGNTAVVHHILALVIPPGQQGVGAMGGAGGYLAAYVPGLIAKPFPKGMAKHIPAGSELVFQVHYTPIGTEQKVTSKIGFVYADPKEVTHQIRSFSAVQTKLEIPPNEIYETSATSKRKLDGAILLSMMPHMHLRGKSFKYELLDPNKPTKILLDVPAFDFNWQTSYRLTNPMALPKGSRIKATAQFDNTEKNLSNPDVNPMVWVGWGDQTDDEMMIGYFDIAEKVDPAKPLPPVSSYDIRDPAAEMFKRYDKDRDGFVTESEFPERSRRMFPLLDTNGDKKLTPDELRKALRQLRRRRR